MRKPIAALLLICLAACALAGCGHKSAAPDTQLQADVTRYGLPEVVSRARETVAKDNTAPNWDYLARSYALAKQPKLAREALQRAVSLDPTYVPAAVLLGRTLLQEGKAPATEQMMRSVLAKTPRSSEAAELLCRALLAQQKAPEALTVIEDALKHDGKSVELLWARADTQGVLKDFDKAEKDYRAAMKLSPKNMGLRMSYVQTLVVGGKKDEAAKLAVETLKLAPDSADAHFMAASALHQAGKLDEAVKEYKEALVINPGMIPAANNLALLLADRNQDTGTAVAWARKAAAMAPKSLAIADTLGWALARDGQLKDGLAILSQVSRAWTTNPTIWYHYGWTLAKSGQKAEAAKWLQQAAGSKADCAADAQKALQELS